MNGGDAGWMTRIWQEGIAGEVEVRWDREDRADKERGSRKGEDRERRQKCRRKRAADRSRVPFPVSSHPREWGSFLKTFRGEATLASCVLGNLVFCWGKPLEQEGHGPPRDPRQRLVLLLQPRGNLGWEGCLFMLDFLWE